MKLDIQLSPEIADLLNDYCAEHNVSPQEVVESALSVVFADGRTLER